MRSVAPLSQAHAVTTTVVIQKLYPTSLEREDELLSGARITSEEPIPRFEALYRWHRDAGVPAQVFLRPR